MLRISALLSAFLVSIGAPTTVLAEGESGDMVLEEIVVTAQKREQSIQDVPIAITAMDGSLLENNGANNLTDLQGIAPNVVLTGLGLIPNIGKIAIRGIAFLDPDPNADPKTGISVDGVPLTRNAGILNDAFDIERVEILRGPQGTLFGRNNLAGTISMVSAKPTEDPGGKVKLTFGDNGLRTIRAAANTGSFADGMLRAKIVGVTRDYDGYYYNAVIGNDLGETSSDGARLTVAFENGRFDATVIADYQDESVIGPGITNHILDADGTGFDGDKYTVNQNLDGFSDLESWSPGASPWNRISRRTLEPSPWWPPRVIWSTSPSATSTASSAPCRFRPFSSTSVAKRFMTSKRSNCDSPTPTATPSTTCWGVFYLEEDYVTRIHSNNFTTSLAQARNTARNAQTAKSLAFFGQSDVHITERLSLVLGGRITMDDKEFSQHRLFPPPMVLLEPEADWDEFTWKAGLQYAFNDDVMGYATVATGYKGGGFNARASVPQNVGPYGSETVTSYEAGMKGDFLDKRMRINAAAYRCTART